MIFRPRVWLRAILAAALLVGAVPLWGDEAKPTGKHDAAPPGKPAASVDDELLKELDDSLGGKLPEKPAAAAARPAKPAAKPSTDEELLKELDAADDAAGVPKPKQPGDDLGQQADPLTRIGTKMRQAETMIGRDKLSPDTTHLQDEIVKDIDELLKQMKKKMQQQQQQQSSSQQQRQQQSSRSSVKPQGKQSQQARQQPGNNGDQQANQPAKESTDQVRKDQRKQVQLDPAAQEELLKRVWGLLPEKDREQMRQAAGDQFLPEYESLIIRYFRRLAEEEDKQP